MTCKKSLTFCILKRMIIRHTTDCENALSCKYGSPGRSAMVREFFEYMASHQGVWFTTGSELVEFCKNNRQKEG